MKPMTYAELRKLFAQSDQEYSQALEIRDTLVDSVELILENYLMSDQKLEARILLPYKIVRTILEVLKDREIYDQLFARFTRLYPDSE